MSLPRKNCKRLIPYMMSPKTLVGVLIMVESNNSICCLEDLFLSGSVNYSIEGSDYHSTSDTSISAEMKT